MQIVLKIESWKSIKQNGKKDKK